jgi:prepilin-type N-terminal cleavage/methylation domain-containing protein/prepilin-type processing-associated H-X9-DG protein
LSDDRWANRTPGDQLENNMTIRADHKSGFTLIELLVVIAIIAILASLLLPALAKAKEQGYTASCQSNVHQMALAVQMYADDNRQYFPDPGLPSNPTWWSPGPFKNSYGVTCGGEWNATVGGVTVPNTPAPMIEPYLKNPMVWVCPKRKRGMTYTTAPGSWDPTVTGFLSYGFNEIGCFCLANPTTGGMTSPTPPFKATLTKQPANLVCIADISGSNNPGDCDGNGGTGSGNAWTLCGDAAWMDAIWEESTGPGEPPDSENGRIQTAWGKHDNRVNVMFVDGHSTLTLASQLTWGQFWGVYGNPPLWPEIPQGWNASISKPAYDSQVWSTKQE